MKEERRWGSGDAGGTAKVGRAFGVKENETPHETWTGVFTTLMSELKAQGHHTLQPIRKKKVSNETCMHGWWGSDLDLTCCFWGSKDCRDTMTMPHRNERCMIAQTTSALILRVEPAHPQTTDKRRHNYCEIICRHSGKAKPKAPPKPGTTPRRTTTQQVNRCGNGHGTYGDSSLSG